MKSINSIKIAYKVFFAALTLSSIILEIVVLSERLIFDPGNFFSFFTVLSNSLAVIVLAVGAAMIYYRKKSVAFNVLRGASALFMVLTGVVFAVLLSDLDPRVLTAVPWDNTVLHYIMPIVMFVDWFVDPPKPAVRMKQALLWLVFPLGYVMYTLIRGPIVQWYPYPFLNPANGGYGKIAITCAVITLFTLAAAWVLVKAQSIHLLRTK